MGTTTMYPLSTSEKLRIQFRKAVRKGHSKNAELDPDVPSVLRAFQEPGEAFISKVARSSVGTYWFSDRRVILELNGNFQEQARYEAIRRAHWMYKDLLDRTKLAAVQLGEMGIIRMKQQHFDRLELELGDSIIVLEERGQSYWPVLHFFRWIT
jgi:hypothetical protein